MCQCQMWELSVFFACLCVYSVTTFNVDSFNYAAYDDLDRSSMFGFSIALHKEGNNGWLIVGAPEAQSSRQRRVFRGGVVYKCPTDRDGNCQEIPFDTKDHMFDQATGQQLDNKTEQWFGATVSSSGRAEGPIVACAPRYTWYPMKFTRRDPVGTCYVSNGLFNQFNEYSPCRTYQWGYHRQGSCQAGFSAAINSIGDRLFIGAPGSWYWQGQMYSIDAHATFEFKPLLFSATYGAKGQVHQQSLEKRPAVFSTVAGTEKDDDSYMGYSTIVGDFMGNGEEGIAVGMPRGNNLLGRVLLFTWNLTDYRHFSGDQLGCYFGYALAASDVDGDGKLDLIVGAPMYTVPNNKYQYDVGRVYVFYHKNGTQKGTYNSKYVIDGFNSKSRFGQALASLGDINQDGYGDFAVGAPYDGKDNRGAVYIYHGSSKGVRKKYSQVIFAEDVVPFPATALSTFGFSITGGLDLDGNQYPDMAVGAYLSNKAFFFRSRPVIRVEAYVKFLTPKKEIDLEKADLLLANDTRAVKTQIQFCSKYYGKGIPSSISLDLQYILDSKKPLNPRMGFVDSEGNNVKNDTIKLYRNETKCIDKPIDVYVRSNIRDKLTPLVAEVKYWMSIDADLHSEPFFEQVRNPRSTLLPVLDLNSPPSQKDSIRVQTNCGDDNVCIPNLKLEVKPRTAKYYFNSKERIELEIFVSNVGEESFETVLEVKYPESLYYGNSIDLKNDTHVLCSDYENHTVKCEIGNPLPNNKGVHFKLWWKPNYDYENLTSEYFFQLLVNSTNPEELFTLRDNRRNITIEILSEHHQEIYQQSIPVDVYFSPELYTADISKQNQNTSQADRLPEEEIGPQAIHIYRLKNEGQITIKKTEIFLMWPARTLAGDDFFYLVEPPHFSGTEKMNVQCGPIPANYRDFEVIGNKNITIWERFNIDIANSGESSAERVWSTPAPPPPPPSDKVGSVEGGGAGKSDPKLDAIVGNSDDISKTLEARMATKRVEIVQTGSVAEYQTHPISDSQYSYRCLESTEGVERQVACGSDFTTIIEKMVALVRQGQIQMGNLQRMCMGVIKGELKEMKCQIREINENFSKRVQIFQTAGGYNQRQRLGNTQYFYSCMQTVNGVDREVRCGPEMASMVQRIARMVEEGTFKIGHIRQCMETVDGEWQEVDCHSGALIDDNGAAVGRVQLFRGNFGMIGDRRQLQRLGNTQYFYRCLKTVDGREEEVECGPEFSTTVSGIIRLMESGITENLDHRCMEEVNGQLKTVDCGAAVSNVLLGRVEVFQGLSGYVGGRYQQQKLGNTQYFYRCLRTRNGREEEVGCGPEFASTIDGLLRHLEQGDTSFVTRKCMIQENGELTPIECGETKTAGRVEVFLGQDGYVGGKYQNQRLGNTNYFYRCLRTVNGREKEVNCGAEFSVMIAKMTELVERGSIDFIGSVKRKCMIEQNGKLIPIQCDTLPDGGFKKVGRVEIFQGRNGYVGGKYQYQRLGNTNYFYRCLRTVNGNDQEINCGPEFSSTIARMTKLVEEGKIESLGLVHRRCMVEENGKLTPVKCEDLGQLNLPSGTVQIFHADIGGDAYEHQRVPDTDYFYRCTQTVNGAEEEVPCGPEFSATIRNITRLLQRGSYDSRQCMKMVKGKLEMMDCSAIFGHLQVTTEAALNVTHRCWIFDDNWKIVDCSSDELTRTVSFDGRPIHRRCFRTLGTSPREEEVDCEQVIRLYRREWHQNSHFQGQNSQYGQGGYGTYSNSSYSSRYDGGYQNGRRDPHTYGTYGGSRDGTGQYSSMEKAALGTGGFQTQLLEVNGAGLNGGSHWSGDDYEGRDNVPTDRPTRQKNWHGRKKRQVIDPSVIEIRNRFPCESTSCEYARCVVENLEHNKELVIALRGRLNARVLRTMSLSEPMRFSTLMAARVVESPVPGVVTDKELVYQEAWSNVKKTDAELKTDIVPLWVVVLSAVAGTIILLLLIFLLYKMGFFKRNRPSSAPERQPLNRNGYHHGDEVL